jgi:anti-anti-sigma regulatory factor
MQAALDALSVGVCVWSLEQPGTPSSLRLVACNQAAARYLGVERDAVIGLLIGEAFPGSLQSPLPYVFSSVAEQGGEKNLGDVPYKDDVVSEGVFSIVAKSFLPNLVLVEFTNITAQRRLEAERQKLLEQTEQKLEDVTKELRRQATDAQAEAEASHELAKELDRKLDIIEEQNRQIRQLSAPVLQIWPGVLVLPLIGSFDGQRSSIIAERLLAAIVSQRSDRVLIDVTALDAVDAQTAREVVKMVTAVRLLGAEAVVTGVRPQIATTLTQLGLDLGVVRTARDLQDGLRLCIDVRANRR